LGRNQQGLNAINSIKEECGSCYKHMKTSSRSTDYRDENMQGQNKKVRIYLSFTDDNISTPIVNNIICNHEYL